MRKSIFAAVAGLALAGLAGDALLAQPVGPPNEIWCNRTSFGSGGPGTTPAVTGVTGRTTNICGFLISATAAATVFILTGTGATCGTGSVSITGNHAIPAGAFINFATGNAWYSTPAGNNVCLTIGGTGPIQFTIFYSQF